MKSKQNIILVSIVVLVILILVLFNANTCGTANLPAPPTTEADASSTTANSGVKATVLSNVNLRSGPGTNYAIVGNVPANSEVTVIGRNEDGAWLQVESNAAEQVWVTSDADLVKIDQTLLAGLPVVEAPALPYDINNPSVNQVLNLIPLVIHHESSFTCASHAGTNNLESVRDGNVIGPHAGDFILGGEDNVLFKYANGSLQLIRENPIARFEGGAESLPFDKAMQMFQKGEITWNGTLGQSPGRGVTGCDPAMK
jgi:hypothetical protein